MASSGICQGSGCIKAIVGLEHTDTAGRFDFDAYGKYNPASDEQYVLPALDSESIGIVVYKPGYLGDQRYLYPEYQDYTDSDGSVYQYTTVPDLMYARRIIPIATAMVFATPPKLTMEPIPIIPTPTETGSMTRSRSISYPA